MTPLRRNVVANFAGHIWGGVISLLFVPIYIHYLGIEAWGLVGFFATLQSLLALADIGLSTTLNRELARASASGQKGPAVHDLVRTLEILYWSIALVCGIAVLVGAPVLATRWLHVQRLPIASAKYALMLMGVVVTLQLPSALYLGGLLGMQRHVQVNAILIVMATIRSLGAVAVLVFISPTVVAYFLWQAIVSGINTVIMGFSLWRNLGVPESPPSFRGGVIANVGRFSTGMMAISIMAVPLTQLDKIILSKMLPLTTFGYYSLAGAAAAALYRIITPFYMSFFPRFTELVTLGDGAGLRRVYHSASQLATTVLTPIAALLAIFSREILLLWTRDATTADNTHVILTLLAAGTALNGFTTIPYALQLAHGWTRLSFWSNFWASVVLLPTLIYFSLRFQALGAASAWVAVNLLYVIVTVRIMHIRLLPGEQGRWYREDVGLPLVASVVVMMLAKAVFPVGAVFLVQLVVLGVILAASFAAAVCFAPLTREVAGVMLTKMAGLARR